jgi:putative transposase
MPYEYRKLTPLEKEEVVQIRKEKGYPLHAPPHPFRDEGYYLITAACYEHAPVMESPARRTEFEIRLLETLKTFGMETSAWVILPNHYHVLVGVRIFEQISQAIKKLHGGISHAWNQVDGITGKRQIWYHYTDRYIRDESHFHRSLNYIHYNPVKHNLVDSPYEWIWSSLSLYLEDRGVDWLRGLWRDYPPPKDFKVE